MNYLVRLLLEARVDYTGGVSLTRVLFSCFTTTLILENSLYIPKMGWNAMAKQPGFLVSEFFACVIGVGPRSQLFFSGKLPTGCHLENHIGEALEEALQAPLDSFAIPYCFVG